MKKTVRFFILFACVFALVGTLSGAQAKTEKSQGILQLCCDGDWEYVGK